MPRVAQKFRRTELTRAIRAAKAAEVKVARAEIGPDGTIVIVMGQSDTPSETTDDLEKWIAAHADSAQGH